MERIISYDEIPEGHGKQIYFKIETDPQLYFALIRKGYRIINNIEDTNDDTIFLTGQRQIYSGNNYKSIMDVLSENHGLHKVRTYPFSYEALIEHQYKLPFVFKNDNANGGKEKFLIATEQDYENLINMYKQINKLSRALSRRTPTMGKYIDYQNLIDENFVIQEYVKTPTIYNTSLRVLTSSSGDLFCSILKYKRPIVVQRTNSLIELMLKEMYPLSTKSIVSNTLAGGSNIIIGESHSSLEENILREHNIYSSTFDDVISSSIKAHTVCKKEIGILCGFDYIYDQEKDMWQLLEYHSRPMVGQYAKAQGIPYNTQYEHIQAEGMVRATGLKLTMSR